VPDLPVTHNGKRSESAARAVMDGLPVRNRDALRNPESLDRIADALRAVPVQAAAAEPDGGSAAERPDGEGIRETVARAFHTVLGASAPPEVSFFDLGGTSRQLMTLLRLLRTELGRWVSMEAFLSHPTIHGVVADLSDGELSPSAVELLLDGDQTAPPLYVVHGAFGDVDSYRFLLAALDVRCRVYGLLGLLEDDGGTHLSIEQVAAAHVATLSAAWPEGQVQLAGYSFGGLVAFEMAQQLSRAGRDVTFLGLLDVRPPAAALTRPELLIKRAAGLLGKGIPGMASRSPWWWRTLRRAPDRVMEGMDDPTAESVAAYDSYRWTSYPGDVTFFRVRRRIPVVAHLMYRWRRLVRTLLVLDVPGAHFDMLSERHATELAATFAAALESPPSGGR
jgi:acetoacetyl-CoA synthetase